MRNCEKSSGGVLFIKISNVMREDSGQSSGLTYCELHDVLISWKLVAELLDTRVVAVGNAIFVWGIDEILRLKD